MILRILLVVLSGISIAQAFDNCKEARVSAQKIVMSKNTENDLSQVQALVEFLVKYEKKPSVDEILKSKTGDGFFQINHFCLFNRDIKIILQKFIRANFEYKLTKKQRDQISSKSLALLSNLARSSITTDGLSIIYDTLRELADADLLKNRNELKKVKLDDFFLDRKQAKDTLTKSLLKSKDRLKLRRAFYQEDIKLASKKLDLIIGFLPKG